jgi:hypothetical protein
MIRMLVVVTLITASIQGMPARVAEEFRSPPRPIAGGKFEASGIVQVPGANGFLFVDDNRRREIFWMEFTPEGTQRGLATSIPLVAEIVDPEGITTDGTFIYIVGSQSKSRRSGPGLMRFVFDPQRRRVERLEAVNDLQTFLANELAELRQAELNIEGLAWDPQDERLLLGLRAPLVDSKAVVVPVKLRQATMPLSAGNLRVEPPIYLDLSGAGIRSMDYDSGKRSFLIITGAALDKEDRDFRVVIWSPVLSRTPLQQLALFADKLKPEGITKANLQGRDVTVIVFDRSRYMIEFERPQ